VSKGFIILGGHGTVSIRKTPALAAVFVVLFSFCAAAVAQVTTGSILGTVRDASGAVVPGATVTVTDTGKGTTSVKQTDTEGNYSVPYFFLALTTFQLR
jgi:Carboxypeptidase regulatory-like domain